MDQSLLNESYADIVLFCTRRMDNVLSSQASNCVVVQDFFSFIHAEVFLPYLSAIRL